MKKRTKNVYAVVAIDNQQPGRISLPLLGIHSNRNRALNHYESACQCRGPKWPVEGSAEEREAWRDSQVAWIEKVARSWTLKGLSAKFEKDGRNVVVLAEMRTHEGTVRLEKWKV